MTHESESAPAVAAAQGAPDGDRLEGAITNQDTGAGPAPQLEFHPLANVFPLLEGKEFDELRNSISAQGWVGSDTITLHENKILDGRNRARALMELGWKESRILKRCVEFDDNGGKVTPLMFVIAKNIKRRHLTADDRKRALDLLYKSNPSMSTSGAAKIAGTSEKTAAAARPEPAGSDTSEPEKRVGKDGKAYTVKPKKQPTPEQIAKREAKKQAKLEADRAESKRLLAECEAEEKQLAASAQALSANLIKLGVGQQVYDQLEAELEFGGDVLRVELARALGHLIPGAPPEEAVNNAAGNDVDPEAAAEARKAAFAKIESAPAPAAKKKRGRPPGSKNKKKAAV